MTEKGVDVVFILVYHLAQLKKSLWSQNRM